MRKHAMPRIPAGGSGSGSNSDGGMSYPIDQLRETAAKILVSASLALQEHDTTWKAVQAYINGNGPRPFNFWSPNQN
jgi:hypothetical protein